MTSTRVALARGFAAAVVVVLLLAIVVLLLGGVSQEWLLAYLLALAFGVPAAAGIWYDHYRLAAVGTIGLAVASIYVSWFMVGLAVLLAVALVVGWSGRAREQLQSQ